MLNWFARIIADEFKKYAQCFHRFAIYTLFEIHDDDVSWAMRVNNE